MTPESWFRRARAAGLAALVVVVAVPVVSSVAQTPNKCPAQIRTLPSRWEAIPKPPFPTGSQVLTAFAVMPQNPDTIYVTNGTSVMRSGNGGCAWDRVLELTPTGSGNLGLSSSTTTITAITIPEAVPTSRHVLLSARELDAGGSSRPHVIYSDTGNFGSFVTGDQGLPPVGTLRDVRVAASNGRVVYASLDVVPSTEPVPGGSGAATGAIYRSDDGGLTWAARTSPLGIGGGSQIADLSVDPKQPNVLFVVAGGKLYRSVDGGTTVTDLRLTDRDARYSFTAVDVFHGPGAAVVSAFSSASVTGVGVMLRSVDGGSTFKQQAGPNGVVESVAHGATKDTLVVGTTPGGSGGPTVALYDPTPGNWQDRTPTTSTAAFGVQFDRIDDLPYARSLTHVLRYVGNPPPKVTRPRRIPTTNFDPVKIDPAVINPRSTVFRLEVGRQRDVEFVLTMPRRPTPLDLFILVDTSTSMSDLIEGVQNNLAKVVRDLRNSGVDIWVGLGKYRTIQDPPLYERLADISKPDASFFNTLFTVEANGGGGTEPVLMALDQVALGKGASDIPVIPLSTCDINPNLPGCSIAPGQQANFRPGTLRVVLHSTDEKWVRRGKDLPESSPSFDQVAADLRSRGAVQVGIDAAQDARVDLEEMARKTGAVAPSGGIDCGGASRIIKVGQPLVCPPGDQLSATILDILNAVRDVQPLELFARGKSPVFTSVTPARIAQVNVKQLNQIKFRARFTCVNVAPGTYDVKIGAALPRETVADASVQVTCGLPPVPPENIQPPIPPPQPQLPVAVQPAPPAPAAQAQLQPQPQVNPNAGLATQEKQQIQVATAVNDIQRDDTTELAMSDYEPRRRTAAAAVTVWGGALLASSCAGVVLARQRARTQEQRN